MSPDTWECGCLGVKTRLRMSTPSKPTPPGSKGRNPETAQRVSWGRKDLVAARQRSLRDRDLEPAQRVQHGEAGTARAGRA